MWSRINNIWRKEIIDNLRDKKALRIALLIPLLVGIFYAVFNPLISSVIADKAKQPLVIPAQGIENAGQSFIDALKAQQITLEPFTGDLKAAVARGDKSAGMIIPPGFSDNVSHEKPAALTLYTNRTSGGIFGGGFSGERLDLAISTYNGRITTQRIESRNIDPAILSPIALNAQDLASPEQLAGLFASFTLPILLATIVAQGGLFVAIDVTAGEKERGTLESLLVTPASDLEVLVGKWLAVFTITCIPIILTFVGFWVASNFVPASATQGGALPLSVILGVILVSLPLALFVDVVLMIVSVRTKAFKDAQSAATPISLAVIVPAMAAAFVTPSSAIFYLIPVYGPCALVSAMATGTQVPPYAYILAILGSLIAAAIGFVIAIRFFNRERMLYGA